MKYQLYWKHFAVFLFNFNWPFDLNCKHYWIVVSAKNALLLQISTPLLNFHGTPLIRISTFPSNAKIASVVPTDKKTDDKYVVFNFRLVSILNCFSKVYENVIKNELVKSMNFHISPFISVYQKKYNMQNVLLRLL